MLYFSFVDIGYFLASLFYENIVATMLVYLQALFFSRLAEFRPYCLRSEVYLPFFILQ